MQYQHSTHPCVLSVSRNGSFICEKFLVFETQGCDECKKNVGSRRLSENRKPTRQLLLHCSTYMHPCTSTENPFWPFFPNIFVTRVNHLNQMFKKTDSKGLSLATVSILGQPPSFLCQKTIVALVDTSMTGWNQHRGPIVLLTHHHPLRLPSLTDSVLNRQIRRLSRF